MKKKYQAAFDKGRTAASKGEPMNADPYGEDAPIASGYWRDGWMFQMYGPPDDGDFDAFGDD